MGSVSEEAWGEYKKINPIGAGIIAGTYDFGKGTIDGVVGIGKGIVDQYYDLRENPEGTIKNLGRVGLDIAALVNPAMPKTEDDERFEKGLEGIISKEINGNLIHGDAYTRASFLTDWALNIGTLFVGGGELSVAGKAGEVSGDLSKVEEISSTAEDIAKTSDEINGIDKLVSNPKISLNPKLKKYVCDSFKSIGKESQDNFNKYLRENVWCDETLSNSDKIDIMIANFDKLIPEQKVNFNVLNEVRILKNAEKSNWGEWPDIDWPDFPGLNKNTAKSVYNGVTGEIEIPNNLDRLGSPYGNNLGVVENGYHCTQNERSICNIENEYARNGYKFEGTYYKYAIDTIKDFDIDNPEESVNKINSIIDIQNKINGTRLGKVDAADIVLWKDDYIKFQNNPNMIELCKEKGIDSTYGVMGEASPWAVNGELITNGGINLERLNIVIGRKTNIPYSTGCYQENDIWYFYGVNERQDLVITKTGTEDEIFSYLYLITKALLKQYSS